MAEHNHIVVTGARVHNLRNINVSIPRNQLTVITGMSGSGKSSLAFDTIFAEGQRRYIDTFSSYARGYIGNIERPDVDRITGLSPVISIDQKTTSRNPRSTVGTVTEVYDYLRLLYARAGVAHSYISGKPMVRYTDEQISQLILSDYAGDKILLLAPLVNNRKGHYKELFESLRKKGYLYVRVDGEMLELSIGMKLDRYRNHTIEAVVDRLIVPVENQTDSDESDARRLRQSIDHAMTQGNGIMGVVVFGAGQDQHPDVRWFSRTLMDPENGLSYPEPAPHTFSFNSPSGWCPCCKGLGRIRPEAETDLRSPDELNDAIHDDEHWFDRLQQLAVNSSSSVDNEDDEQEETPEFVTCPECGGKRLNPISLSYTFAGKNIYELANMDIDRLLEFFESLRDGQAHPEMDTLQQAIAEPIIKEICSRLRFMLSVGLSYLSLSRSSESLSGGESQRIRLATQLGSRLVNVLYILDEPSIGLHQRDNQRLINSLKELRDMGNSVIVVEHDDEMMRQADWLVDIGPGAGRLGGQVVFQGTVSDLLKADTLTARYLRGDIRTDDFVRHCQDHKATDSPADKKERAELVLTHCTGNNLKDVTLHLPLGQMVCVTGVSGSGKSSLINQTLFPILNHRFYRAKQKPLPYESCSLVASDGTTIDIDDHEFTRYIDKVINVNQSPIGRTPRSNPATYTDVFTDIRNLFAQLPEAKIRSWKPGRFSFNAKGGRCEECKGNGVRTIQMHFMPDVNVPCETCGGLRYNRETQEVRFKGKSIGEVLDMTVNQAVEFFDAQPTILRKIKSIQDVGLGYLKLGQSSTTLSGGESQRIKLVSELSRPQTGRTLYILDEPTTGLHFEDIRVLMSVLRRLTDRGNTVLLIEHNLDVIRQCDHIIDLGPEGGRGGGMIIAAGSLDQVKQHPQSLTAQFL